jgi:hypothetical protein
MIHLKDGEVCEVMLRHSSAATTTPWARAQVILASKNGRSLALVLDHALTGSDFFIHKELGKVTMLVTWDDARGWEDVGSGAQVELRQAE